jgi:hypothetical protein
MARRSRPQSTSPNKVLVIFLVIFLLATIGFGGWVFMLYREKDKWDVTAKDKMEELKYEKQTREWLAYQRDELLAALGGSEFSKNAEALKNWKENRQSFMKNAADSRFKGEEGEKEFRDYINTWLTPKLNGFDDGYKTKFVEVAKPLEDKAAKLQAAYAQEKLRNDKQQQDFIALQKKYDDDRQKIVEQNQKNHEETLKARTTASAALTEALKINSEQKAQFDKDGEKDTLTLAKLRDENEKLKDAMEKQVLLSKSPNRTTGEPHALMLDISKGKPLWDVPRGKILRVDDTAKKVFIDRGSKDGIRPGLTFNVFAAGRNGRGEGELKATIEVVRVDGERTAMCKVNTFYNIDGREIAVSDATPASIMKEGASVLKEGDLLFNLFWGTHVAIVGVVEFPGSEGKSAAVQMDRLNEFMRYLERLGITVDAYTDLRDGKLIGELSNKTNYLIRGRLAGKLGSESDDSRAKEINSTLVSLMQQAIERGLFVISPDNLAVVTGFRRTSDEGTLQTQTFVPGRPAGSDVGPKGQ